MMPAGYFRIPEVSMRSSIAGTVAAFLAMTGIALAAPAPVTRLAPKDIQTAFFTGQAFTAATPNNIKYKMLFSADGKVTREPLGKSGVKGDGTWKLDKDGFCTTWKGSKPNCFRVVPNGTNKWSVMRGTSLVATWTKE
jgi:hypothetical protein